jgi:TusA-related sulfurtransferase
MNRTLTLMAFLSFTAAACTHGAYGSRSGGSAATAATTSGATPMAEACPMNVPGTQVSAADIATGETITFTTTSPDQVTALREKVHAMAEMHNHHHAAAERGAASDSAAADTGHASAEARDGEASDDPAASAGSTADETAGASAGSGGGMPEGHMGGMAGHAGSMEGAHMPPPSRASVEDVPNGARIAVTPNDPADLSRLQSTVRMHAQHMQEHGCAMMGAGHADR